MSILSLPTLTRTAPTDITFSLVPNTMYSQSPLNRAIQTTELPGARFKGAFTYRNLVEADARILKAWLNKLSGRAGRFYLHDQSHPLPSGTAAGTPLVKGASQVGRTLLTDGWTPNQATLLKPGDYFGVGTQLCVITDPIASNSSGEATLLFEAPLRISPADNTAIITNRPTGIMILADDEQDKFLFDPRRSPSVTIEWMEAF